MGTRLSHHRSSKPGVIITITPRDSTLPHSHPSSSSSPLPPASGTLDEETLGRHNQGSNGHTLLPPETNSTSTARCTSRSSTTSGGSLGPWRNKRKVSFDLLAEMAVVMPNKEQPVKTLLVEVGDKGQEEEAMDMGDICDGSSTTSCSDDAVDRGGGRGERGGKFGECSQGLLPPGVEEEGRVMEEAVWWYEASCERVWSLAEYTVAVCAYALTGRYVYAHRLVWMLA